ncbi:tetratricopeptide repeat protein [Amycolatopsis anabasis]|uniref:tetratricopeptide repeat protein n=1 Tax=Amycolatopsis anabasis TaxID=1840409 RepID=UPI00131D7727|nr:tetratricopeptide repeat protein [Amycolatopsis anabasis]
MILACGGWACQRFISQSDIRGGNPVARQDQEHFSSRFQVCADCRKNFCDRCVPFTLLRRTRCPLCGGRLVDGQRADRVWGTPLPGFVLYHNKGIELSESGQFRAALVEFDEAARRRPEYRSAHFHRGVLLARVGRDQEALRAFQRVIQLDPRNIAARFELGKMLRQLGKPAEAVRAYDRVLRLEPRYAIALTHKAIALTDLGHHDEALAACDTALRLHATNEAVEGTAHVAGTAYAAQTAVFLKLGQYDDALAAIDNSLQYEPDNADSYVVRARILDELGREAEARRDRRQAERLRDSQPG